MLRKFFIYIIVCYKHYISPLTPPSCRFTPSCSSYFIQSLEHYGLLKGMILSIIRILKCHPFHPGGYDPIIKE